MTPHPTPENLILIIVDAAGGRVSGKTLLQKRAFFVCRDLDIHGGFRPHYYGPYSPDIDNAIGRAKALGFLYESMQGFGKVDHVGFEWRRYDYTLTDDGRRVLADIEKHAPRQVAAIRKCLAQMQESGDNGDYVSLSIAAKTHFILQREGKPMNPPQLRETAKRFGWNIRDEEVERAATFLERMGLVQRGAHDGNP